MTVDISNALLRVHVRCALMQECYICACFEETHMLATYTGTSPTHLHKISQCNRHQLESTPKPPLIMGNEHNAMLQTKLLPTLTTSYRGTAPLRPPLHTSATPLSSRPSAGDLHDTSPPPHPGHYYCTTTTTSAPKSLFYTQRPGCFQGFVRHATCSLSCWLLLPQALLRQSWSHRPQV